MDHSAWKTKKAADQKMVIEVHEGYGGGYTVYRGYYDDAGFQGETLATIEPARFLKGDNKKAYDKWIAWVIKNSGKAI